MTVSASEFLTYAEGLLDLNDSEINCRTIINRAYYSAYYACQDFHMSLSSPGIQAGKPSGVHDTLFQQLANPSIKRDDPFFFKSKSISYMIDFLKKKRNIADYRLEETVSIHEAAQAIEDAIQIKEKAESR